MPSIAQQGGKGLVSDDAIHRVASLLLELLYHLLQATSEKKIVERQLNLYCWVFAGAGVERQLNLVSQFVVEVKWDKVNCMEKEHIKLGHDDFDYCHTLRGGFNIYSVFFLDPLVMFRTISYIVQFHA